MSFNYEEMRSSFTLDCPENFNFAFDVLAQKALQLDKPALISIDNQGNHIRDVSYKEIDEVSVKIIENVKNKTGGELRA